MLWSISLVFKNKISNEIVNDTLEYEPYYTYYDLFYHVKWFCKSYGWKIKITKYNVAFSLASYTQNPVDVDDWNRYILNTDKIIVSISDPNESLYGLFTKRGKKLLKVNQLQKIYNDIDIEKLNQPLFIWEIDSSNRKIKLLDVIDNPAIYYNRLINRLVAKYGDRFIY